MLKDEVMKDISGKRPLEKGNESEEEERLQLNRRPRGSEAAKANEANHRYLKYLQILAESVLYLL